MKLIDIPGESQADPYIIESGGKFYVYATGETGVVLYRRVRFVCRMGKGRRMRVGAREEIILGSVGH